MRASFWGATIADCMATSMISAFWRKVEIEEIVPMSPPCRA
jgi:hypothetical protein